MNKINFTALKQKFPEIDKKIARLEYLSAKENDLFNIAVYGKYNHGKSSLLNALIGIENHFKVADCRTTIKNDVFIDESAGIQWIDTPGLNADIEGEDDSHAVDAITREANLILFVHSLRIGELDQAEIDYLNELLTLKSASQIILVLTQQDQLRAEQFEIVYARIEQQVQDVKIRNICISTTRYFKGLSNNNSVQQDRSNMGQLQQMLHENYEHSTLQRDEFDNLIKEIIHYLENQKKDIEQKRAEKQQELRKMHTNFQNDVKQMMNKIQQNF